jgi:hypothetical protein
MSDVALFAVGLIVTLLALAGTSLLVFGAVLDGRDERATRLRLLAAVDGRTTPHHDDLDDLDTRAAAGSLKGTR